MRRLTLNSPIFLVAIACLALGGGWIIAASQSPAAGPKMTDGERALVVASRNVIVRTGMSGGYFDRHFKLVKVTNQPGDRRIVWKFSINGYETIVSDVLGYYSKDGKQFDTHSVTTTLRATSDITRTLSRQKANQIMQQCIGTFRKPSVEYRVADNGGARLFLTAESVPKGKREKEERREREEREERERQAKPKPLPGTDVIEDEGDEYGPPITVGSVDLQSGKCTKGKLEVARAATGFFRKHY